MVHVWIVRVGSTTRILYRGLNMSFVNCFSVVRMLPRCPHREVKINLATCRCPSHVLLLIGVTHAARSFLLGFEEGVDKIFEECRSPAFEVMNLAYDSDGIPFQLKCAPCTKKSSTLILVHAFGGTGGIPCTKHTLLRSPHAGPDSSCITSFLNSGRMCSNMTRTRSYTSPAKRRSSWNHGWVTIRRSHRRAARGRHLKEFVANGPKSDAYRDKGGKDIAKTLFNVTRVNFESCGALRGGCALLCVRREQ